MRGTKFFRTGIALVTLMTLLLICNIAAAQIIPGRYIVVFRDDVVDSPVAAAAIARANGLALDHTYSFALKGFAAAIPKARLNVVAKDQRVAYIEPDLEVHICQQTLPTGIDRIDADLNATAKIDGIDERVDVDVAIIDTGIDGDHPDLNVVGGVNFAPNPGGKVKPDKWDDGYGHGTHVAGTVAALDNGFGVVGVAPGARLWAVKVLNNLSGTGRLSDVVKGVDWVTEHHDTIEVVNMSLGTDGKSDAFRTAIQNSVAVGVAYFVAAGNNPDQDLYGADGIFPSEDDQIPAAYPEVAAVSALSDTDGKPGGEGPLSHYGEVDQNGDGVPDGADDSLAWFSNFSSSVVQDNPVTSPGAAIDLLMPGVDIYSTHKNSGYATKSGTSMATPHASGLAALYIAVNGRAYDVAGVYAIRQALIDGGVAQTDSLRGLAVQNDPDGNKENIGWAGPLDVHDVAITGISAPSWVLQGDVVNVDVDVANEGTYGETFDVSLTESPDGFTETQTITLAAGTSTTVSFSWQTSTLTTLGDHALTATADTVTGETDTSDNSKGTIVNVQEKPTGNENDMYVWAIDFSERHYGKGGSKTDLMTTVTIRRDSDADGTAESTDELVSKARVEMTLSKDTGESWNFAGDTGDDGTVTFTLKFAGDGTYTATVTNVTHATYTYNPVLNVETEDIHTIGSSAAVSLGRAFPSPANPETWIPFTLSQAERVVIRIYDVTGRLVRTLNLGQKAAGAYVSKEKAVYWDGRNANGEKVSSGIYFYLMEAGSFRAAKKMLIIR